MKEMIYEKAIKLLSESNTLALSLIDIDNFPKTYAMEKVISYNLDKVFFITKKDSKKVYLLEKNNKCCVEIHTENDSLSLKGTIEINKSDEDKSLILPYEYVKRLEKSGSNKYCILIFNTMEADIYIDDKTKKFTLVN